MPGPRIINTARKHGVSDDDMLHALRNPARVFGLDDEMTMVVGPGTDGTPLEVGFVPDAQENIVVIHAMKARGKYLRW